MLEVFVSDYILSGGIIFLLEVVVLGVVLYHFFEPFYNLLLFVVSVW